MYRIHQRVDVEPAEEVVPEREDRAHVPVAMLWQHAVVDLVLRRADENVIEDGAERDPEL